MLYKNVLNLLIIYGFHLFQRLHIIFIIIRHIIRLLLKTDDVNIILLVLQINTLQYLSNFQNERDGFMLLE